jgi:hypothetical protein
MSLFSLALIHQSFHQNDAMTDHFQPLLFSGCGIGLGKTKPQAQDEQ